MPSRREFPDFDEATVSNLRGLEELAGDDGQPGDFATVDRLVLAAIRRIKRLPTALHRHIVLEDFMIGNGHERGTPERRVALWQRLAGRLSDGLDRVADDSALRGGDVGDRAETRAEAMSVVCRELREAIGRRGDLDPLVRRLATLASGTAAAPDARELRRHLEMKRVPDVDQWRTEMMRLVQHAARIASELHYLPAN